MGAAATQAQPTRHRLAGLDGLRCIAALTVMLVHTWEVSPAGIRQFPGAATYVDAAAQAALVLFFTLSGYLIYMMFIGPAAKDRPFPSTRAYLFNRLLRIFPAYWVILTATVLAGVAAGAGGHSLRPGGFDNLGTALANYGLVQTYIPHTLFSGIGAAWSLTVEVAFYLTLPLLAVLAGRLAHNRTGRQRLLAFCVPAMVLFVVGIAGKSISHHVVGLTRNPDTWNFVLQQSLLAKADLFAWGMVVAAVTSLLPRERWVRWPTRRMAIVGVVAILIGTFGNNTVFMAFGCGAILLWNMVSHEGRPSPAARFFSLRVVTYLGLISYSIYLWHGPVIFFLDKHGISAHGWFGVVVNPLMVSAVTIGLAAISYRFVEAPALRLKRSMTPRSPSDPAFALAPAAASKAAP